MAYIYHLVPKNMRGTVLYPLNQLKGIHPDVYASEVKKYEGREQVMSNNVAILNCAWNDMLHFSAVHPKEIARALGDLGVDRSFECYEIDANTLDSENTVVYLNSPREKGTKIPESDFVPFNPTDVGRFASLPKETIEYYREVISKGKRPLLYHLIPHVLYKGPIDISGSKIIKV